MAFKTKHGVNDLVLLEELSDAAILKALQSHHAGDEIYTYIGQVLISVNPFKNISGLYADGLLKKYKGKNEHQNQPHVYAIAERAYRKMVQDLGRECVIISGESGAGKTEASKKIMEYIAAVSSKAKEVQKVKEQLLESNPLLEAFGNAKTVRNNNSSRFGKYMEIQFDIADPVGGRISVYLLEKNRVIERQPGERNFHIFYQMLAGASRGDKKSWCLESEAAAFNYLSNSECYTVERMNDAQEYADTRNAMNVIGLGQDQQAAMFKLLSAVLHLGNITFANKGDACEVTSAAALKTAASMLEVSADELGKQLTHKLLKTGTESIMSPLTAAAASQARDSLSRGVYGRLFIWLVDRANESIHVDYFSNTIGVLDIYGFEIFGVNGFEQLCINYVNETLHQLFIELTLDGEQKEYEQEGIQWEKIQYYNNKPICDLIQARGQIFSLLDEESIFPNGSDQSLFEKLQQQLKQNKDFVVKDPRSANFMVKHYAGEVEYSSQGFIEKNKDLMFPNLIHMAASSAGSLLKQLFQADMEALGHTSKRPKTSCMQFKGQVTALMTTLRSCRQHYIRCIKPNDDKRPNSFTADMVLSQVRYLGLLENVKVRRAGYAYRITFEEMLAKYKACSSRHIEHKENHKGACEELLKELGIKDAKMGKTKVFIRSPVSLFTLEDLRTAFLQQCQTLLPPDDQLIYADKVIGYNAKGGKGPLLFIISALNAYLLPVKGPGTQTRIDMKELQAISLGDKDDGFMVLHCQQYVDPEKPTKKGAETRFWDVLVENVYRKELLGVVEVLRTSGVSIDVRSSDVIPDTTNPTSPNYVAPGTFKGTNAKKKKCAIM